MLSQLDSEGKDHPIAYGGRAFRMNITEKEGLAFLEVDRQFSPNLSSLPFTVYTENVFVKWLQQIIKIVKIGSVDGHFYYMGIT